MEEETTTPVNKGAGLRMHKSVKNFAEGNVNEKSALAAKNEEKYAELKSSKSTSSMMRSSSATYFERDENAKMTSAASTKNLAHSAVHNDKSPNGKVSNINGNIIHLTVNNYLAPVNNANLNSQSTTSNGFSSNLAIEKEQKPKQALPPSQITRPASSQAAKYNPPEESNKNEGIYESNKLMYSDSSYSNVNSHQAPEKSNPITLI